MGKDDYSVYTGTSGIAFLYFLMAMKLKKPEYYKKSLKILENTFPRLKNRRVSFLTGDSGPLALGSVMYDRLGMPEESLRCAHRVKEILPTIVSLNSDLPDEILYGRAGYLYSLLFMNKYVGAGTIENSVIKEVVTAILASGKNRAIREKRKVPLMYMWHEKYYLGAAHGISGILFLLLQPINPSPKSQALSMLRSTEISINDTSYFVSLTLQTSVKSFWRESTGSNRIKAKLLQFRAEAREYISQSDLQNAVRPTIDFVQDLCFPSGNFPSSLGNSNDRLVQWCHGAPGMVDLFTLAYHVFRDDRYMQTAIHCGNVVWNNGILTKSYGICHGVAGNAYTFLTLYKSTKMEGLAGVVYFLTDIQDPEHALFPAYGL
ncbi:LanC-like protein 3 homolog [Gryllus bimaculatus]|nr:LanC-like protein 3 homolog [Gryllus bimaculatus]